MIKSMFSAALITATLSLTSASAATLTAIGIGTGDKIFSTEAKRDQRANTTSQTNGVDIILRDAGPVSAGSQTASNFAWGVSGTVYDWSLSYDGTDATFMLGGTSVERMAMPGGVWNGFQIFGKAEDTRSESAFSSGTVNVTVNALNGAALGGASLLLSATDGAFDQAWSSSETITSIGGTMFFAFENPTSVTPNSRMQFSVKALEVTPVPVPAALPLLLAGIGGLALMRRRKRS